MSGWLGINDSIAHLAGELRGDFSGAPPRDHEFYDRLKSTRDSLRLVQFQVDYYITTSADGLNIRGCSEIHYGDYLRMMADCADRRLHALFAPTPI